MKFLVVSGLSGAGKSQVATLLEDMGYFCVDNMPVQLIPRFAELCMASEGKYDRVALVTDVRSNRSFDELFRALGELSELACGYQILFVEATPEIIMQRYKATRRRHPLAVDGQPMEDTVAHEFHMLEPVRSQADYIVNTSVMTTNQLRDHLRDLFSDGPQARVMVVMVGSFGFKYGVPRDSDLVFDVRFLPNPFHVYELRPLTGNDEEVFSYVNRFPETQEFFSLLKGLITFLLPQYIEEGKTSLVISIGCTGGRHRSVAIARMLYEYVGEIGYRATLTHRDIARG
ncbi:MAG: RNase adapter RapZ [Oscillospiraceae bacterium]|jgi:UPF0042 nucleotide-binding protein|nr:RNase adapter RapZ [Oscillospiraceae bacterium]